MTGNIADPVMQTISYHLGTGYEKPLLIMISFGFMGSMVALHTAGSRTLYSFGRDKMIPGSRFATMLSKNRKLPWVALSFTAAISIIVLLVNLGAERVFSTLLQISAAGFFISYGFVVISQLVLHVKKRHAHGPFNLGKWSYPITAIAAVWIVFEVINLMWPRSPSLPWYQNWGVLTISVAWRSSAPSCSSWCRGTEGTSARSAVGGDRRGRCLRGRPPPATATRPPEAAHRGLRAGEDPARGPRRLRTSSGAIGAGRSQPRFWRRTRSQQSGDTVRRSHDGRRQT